MADAGWQVLPKTQTEPDIKVRQRSDVMSGGRISKLKKL